MLERGRIGQSWSSKRWDPFTLSTRTWMNGLHGDEESDLGEPLEGFVTHHDLVAWLEANARHWDLRKKYPPDRR